MLLCHGIEYERQKYAGRQCRLERAHCCVHSNWTTRLQWTKCNLTIYCPDGLNPFTSQTNTLPQINSNQWNNTPAFRHTGFKKAVVVGFNLKLNNISLQTCSPSQVPYKIRPVTVTSERPKLLSVDVINTMIKSILGGKGVYLAYWLQSIDKKSQQEPKADA